MKNQPARAGLLLALFLFGAAGTTGTARPEEFSGATPLEWSVRLANSEIARRGSSLAWQPGGRAKWDYAAGLFTLALLQLNAQAPDARYEKFARDAIGSFIAPDGKIQTYQPGEFQLDALNSGRTVLALWRSTGDPRFKNAAQMLRRQLATQPRTADGGFWHKQRYPQQMWLDGIYMAAPFYAECARAFNEPDALADVARQIQLADEHTYDAQTGLFFHGWDASRSQAWANPATGCSSNVWGRAVGWYAMALVDVLDDFPARHPARPQIIATLQKLAAGVVKYQDPKTGLWWQVMDQGGRKGNYLEATASAMFVYALAKGVNHGYLPRDDADAAAKGYAGIIKNLLPADGDKSWSLTQCCSVAGLGFKNAAGRDRDGSFDYYVSEPIVKNDLKGVGPFILAGIEMQPLAAAKNK
jgi:unsaturated rhamnogalacturonyl hydrolase